MVGRYFLADCSCSLEPKSLHLLIMICLVRSSPVTRYVVLAIVCTLFSLHIFAYINIMRCSAQYYSCLPAVLWSPVLTDRTLWTCSSWRVYIGSITFYGWRMIVIGYLFDVNIWLARQCLSEEGWHVPADCLVLRLHCVYCVLYAVNQFTASLLAEYSTQLKFNRSNGSLKG